MKVKSKQSQKVCVWNTHVTGAFIIVLGSFPDLQAEKSLGNTRTSWKQWRGPEQGLQDRHVLSSGEKWLKDPQVVLTHFICLCLCKEQTNCSSYSSSFTLNLLKDHGRNMPLVPRRTPRGLSAGGSAFYFTSLKYRPNMSPRLIQIFCKSPFVPSL